jgi:hypothetical protein
MQTIKNETKSILTDVERKVATGLVQYMLQAQEWLTLRYDLNTWKAITKLDGTEEYFRTYFSRLQKHEAVVWVGAVSLPSGLTVQRQDGIIKPGHNSSRTPPVHYLPSSSLLNQYSSAPEEANSIQWAKAEVARLEHALSDEEGHGKVQSTNIKLDLKRRQFILDQSGILYNAMNQKLNLQPQDYHNAVREALRQLPSTNLPSGTSLNSFRTSCIPLIHQRYNQVLEQTFRRSAFK